MPLSLSQKTRLLMFVVWAGHCTCKTAAFASRRNALNQITRLPERSPAGLIAKALKGAASEWRDISRIRQGACMHTCTVMHTFAFLHAHVTRPPRCTSSTAPVAVRLTTLSLLRWKTHHTTTSSAACCMPNLAWPRKHAGLSLRHEAPGTHRRSNVPEGGHALQRRSFPAH